MKNLPLLLIGLFTINGQAELRSNPTYLDFGNVYAYERREEVVELFYEEADEELRIQSTCGDEIIVEDDCDSFVEDEGRCELRITFAPQHYGSVQCGIRLDSDYSGSSFWLPVQGFGYWR